MTTARMAAAWTTTSREDYDVETRIMDTVGGSKADEKESISVRDPGSLCLHIAFLRAYFI